MKNLAALGITCMLLCCWTAKAQNTYWRPMKANVFYNKSIRSQQRNPEVLRANLLKAIDHTRGKLKIFFCILLAEHDERNGDFASAEKYYQQAYAETKTLSVGPLRSYLPFQSGTIYDGYDKLAYFYLKTGNLRKAGQLFKESRIARDAVYPKRSVFRVRPVIGMGSLSFRKERYDSTYAFFNQAMAMMNRATTTNYDYDQLNRLFLADLAEICLALGKHKEASDYIEKLSIASSGFAKFNSGIVRKMETARIFELKARYYLLEGDFSKAREYLDRAREYNSSRVASSDVTFKILKTEALLHWYQGNIAGASLAFQKLVAQYREYITRNFVAMSEYEKEQFYNTLKNDFDLFNAYVTDVDEAQAGPLLEEMYDNIINTKALLLNATNRQKNAIVQSGDAALIDKLHQWERSKAALASRYFAKEGEGEIESLEKNIESLEKEINRSTGLFKTTADAPHWKQVKEALKEGEAALEIVRVNTVDRKHRNGYAKNGGLSDTTVYVVLMLTPSSVRPEYFVLRGGNALETKFLPFYRNAIFGRIDDPISYDRFWLPIRKHLNGIHRVYLSPDGVYNQINLNTLKNPASGQYLIDEIELVSVTNTADLLREKEGVLSGDAVLFGRPAYRFDALSQKANDQRLDMYGLRNILTDELVNLKEQEFADLPGTETEINEIERTLRAQGLSVTAYKGAQALEENVKAVRDPAILHIATHGFFVEDSASLVNPMIRSGMVMAGVQNSLSTEHEDGILTAYEATNLDLEHTNLVVLSACETGLGEIRNGEGVYGLQRAVIVAGAANLLMSLWKVDDEATAALMVNFYKSWKEQGNLASFRKAQIALREKFPDPFYWGAFIMLGN